MKKTPFAVAAVISLLVPMTSALAAGTFPDVPAGYPFYADIELLVQSRVIKGNPDGNFYPNRPVNRAEFLKLLYTATQRAPKSTYTGCFSDIEKGSWYESYVCDAASKERGFVSGYSDGKFRPGSPVSRTEALKMVFTVFELDTSDVSELDRSIVKFVDISTSAWYTKYLSAAYTNRMLPIAGQSGDRFYPDQALTRGEAAAYIVAAGKVMYAESNASSSSSAVSSSASSVAASSSASTPAFSSKDVSFPFTDAGQFDGKKPVTYLFSVSTQTTANVRVSAVGFHESQISCRLYLMGEDGFSTEYYLGYQNGGECIVKSTLKPGKYQLQIQPTSVSGVAYTVDAKPASGDGNDGFIDAVTVGAELPRTAILDNGDIFDWYKFSVPKAKTLMIDVTASEMVNCIIYTPASVDQFGFKGPECGVQYEFQASDDPYIIGIGRKTGDTVHKVPYTIKWN